jgi:exonuclease SbcD
LRLLAQVRRLADHCPVLMLQGTWSHEPPGTLSVFRMLGSRHRVHVADRIGQVGVDGQRIGGPGSVDRCVCRRPSTEGPPQRCRLAPGHCSPALPRSTRRPSRAAVGATAAAEAGEHWPGCCSGYAGIHGLARAAGVPTLAVSGHLLGHIHRHQAWEREGRAAAQCIAYAGSIGRFHHGEAGDKGFLLWEVGPDGVRCRLEADARAPDG